MKINWHFWIRKSHRYLGLFIGLQFLGWTISGLYFSWSNLDNVHGDHLRKATSTISTDFNAVAPNIVVENLKAHHNIDSIKSIQLIRVLDEYTYQVAYYSANHENHHHAEIHFALANASTGEMRQPLGKEEAIQVASRYIVSPSTVSDVAYLEETDSHHEYREGRLPVWAITFSAPDCTVYVHPESGTFQTIRHNQWRVFDFLWMFHTMDYAGRDNFNNWLLKIFSIMGVVTVFSGFTLFIVSSKPIKRLFNKTLK